MKDTEGNVQKASKMIYSLNEAKDYSKDSVIEGDKATIGALIDIYNITNAPKKIMCIIASYEDGRLVCCENKEVVAKDGNVVSVKTESVYTENTDKMKIMVFEKETLRPLTDVKIIVK